jgi:hypothetical protein
MKCIEEKIYLSEGPSWLWSYRKQNSKIKIKTKTKKKNETSNTIYKKNKLPS